MRIDADFPDLTRSFKLAITLLLLVLLLVSCNIFPKPAPKQPAPEQAPLETLATTFPVNSVTGPSGILKMGSSSTASFWVSDHLQGFCRMDNGAITPSTCQVAPNGANSAGQASFLETGGGSGFVFVPDNSSQSQGVWRHPYDAATDTVGPGVLISDGVDIASRPTSTTIINGDLYVGYIKSDVIHRIPDAGGTPGTAISASTTSDGVGAFGLAAMGTDLYIAQDSGLGKVIDITNPDCNNELTPCIAELIPTSLAISSAIAVVGTDIFIADIDNIVHYRPSDGFEEVWSANHLNPTAVFAVATGSGVHDFLVYIGTDPTAGAGVAQGQVDKFAFGENGPNTGAPPAISRGVKVGVDVTAPGSLVKMGPDWWVSDHINGFCRMDVGSNGLLAINTSTCKTNQISPGGASFDPVRNFVYVSDNSAQGDSVYRYPYNPSTRLLGNAMRFNLNDSKSRPSATALSADGTKLFVSYVRRDKISRITNPFASGSSLGFAAQWGRVSARGSESITVAKNAAGQETLYATADVAVEQVSINCSSNCNTTPTTIAADAPVALGSDGNNTILISNGVIGNSVLRYNVLTNTTEVLATQGYYPAPVFERNFKFVSALAAEVNSSGIVTHVMSADDPSAGDGPEGDVWRIVNPLTAITLQKNVINDHGGTATATDFQSKIDGDNVNWGQMVVVNPGSAHTITETGGSNGYLGSLACIGGTMNGNQLTVPANQSVVCTFTNNDVAPQLTVVTSVDNANGGSAAPNAFNISVTGTQVSPATFNGAGAPGTLVTMDAGNYSVSATGPAGYDINVDSGCTGDLGIGESATCTVTATSQQGGLVVQKVVNDGYGSTATPANFSFSLDNGATSTPFNASGENTLALPAGSYTVTETAAPGFDISYSYNGNNNCDNINVVVGDTKTCVITNTPKAPSLTLENIVVGAADPTDWTLTADGPTPLSGTTGVNGAVNIGTYTLSADGPAGYEASAWSCVNGSLTDDQLTIALGESMICSITHTQITHLKLEAKEVHDHGGQRTINEWTVAATGPSTLSGAGGAEGNVEPGEYTLSETGPSDYEASDWSCTGGTLNGNVLTLERGNNVSCEITNDDKPGTLIVEKFVVNNNEGSSLASDFSVDHNGESAGFFEADSQDNLRGSLTLSVVAGMHTVTESPVAGYVASYSNCEGIVISNGGTATCTINNDDVATHLKLVKAVTNDSGGNAEPTAWTLTATGPTTFSGDGVAESDVVAGVYTLSESANPLGYTPSDNWTCTAGALSGNQLTLALGDNAVCTSTSDDQQATITLVNTITNNSGGTATLANFPVTLDGGSASWSVAIPVTPGSHSVATALAAYAPSPWGDACAVNGSFSIALGESKTCTISHDDISAKLKVTKLLLPTTDGGRFNLTIDGTVRASKVGNNGTTGFVDVLPGSHTIAETAAVGSLANYTTTYGGACAANGSVSLVLGETKECTITNVRNARLTITTVVQGGTDRFAYTRTFGAGFTLPTTTGVTSSTSNVPSGTQHSVTQTLKSAYALLTPVCTSTNPATVIQITANSIQVTPAAADVVNCTFTNVKKASVTVVTNLPGRTGNLTIAYTGTMATNVPTSNGAGSRTVLVNAGANNTIKQGTLPTGWRLDNASCVDSVTGTLTSSTGPTTEMTDINLDIGATVTCTFNNVRP